MNKTDAVREFRKRWAGVFPEKPVVRAAVAAIAELEDKLHSAYMASDDGAYESYEEWYDGL